MRAFQTTLKPSRSLKILSALLHFSAAAVCFVWFYGWMMWAGFAALMLSFAHSRRVLGLQTADAVRKISVDRHARASVFYGEKEEAAGAVLHGSTMLTPYALFLQWDTGGKTIRQCVTPDMTDKESYRRLKVWARWCQVRDKDRSEQDTVD